jgi:hypothetical protein
LPIGRKSASSLEKKEPYRQYWGESKSQFAADGIGDGLEIAGVIAAEGIRLSGDSGKPEDPQYTEIAQGLKNSLYRWYIDGGRPISPRMHSDDF